MASGLERRNLIVNSVNALLQVGAPVERASRSGCHGLEHPAYFFEGEADLLVSLDKGYDPDGSDRVISITGRQPPGRLDQSVPLVKADGLDVDTGLGSDLSYAHCM